MLYVDYVFLFPLHYITEYEKTCINTNIKEKGLFEVDSLFMSSERSCSVLLGCSLQGVPVPEGVCLLGVSARGVPGLRTLSVMEESRRSMCTAGTSLLLSLLRTSAVCRPSCGRSGLPGEAGTGSARELCLTEFRLCARTRDQLVARKVSDSNQKRTRWSAPRCSMKCT